MRVAIVGAGIVGSAIAYELGRAGGFQVTVFDRAIGPVQADLTHYSGGTGAALGVLMGVICKKEKGRNLQRRLAGLDWYDRVIPELETVLRRSVTYNRQGLLMLQYDAATWEQERSQWEKRCQIRSQQGRRLEIWSSEQVGLACPHVPIDSLAGAIYSPDDRQVNPVQMTQALILGAERLGVEFVWNAKIESLATVTADIVVVAAGVGSRDLAGLAVRSVLGQAIQVRMPQPLGKSEFQPVVTGKDVHIVPVNLSPDNRDYWIGGTVEFGQEELGPLVFDRPLVIAQATVLDELWQWAMTMVPALAQGERVRVWQGMRPRPIGQPAPVIEWQSDRVLLATAHYRNGVLLAPATAIEVREKLEEVRNQN